MRVVTAALSIASIVSGRPGPVPGAGGNCARAKKINSATPAKNSTSAISFFVVGKRTSLFRRGRWTSRCNFRNFKNRGVLLGRDPRPLFHFFGPDQEGDDSEGDFEQSPFAECAGMPEQPTPAHHRT